jgi:hypothetical protein
METKMTTETGWSNAAEIEQSFPLLCDTLHKIEENIRKNRGDIEELAKPYPPKRLLELEQASGFKAFDTKLNGLPVAVDLAARFIECMTGFQAERCADSFAAIKDMVALFFAPTEEKTGRKAPFSARYRCNYLEINVLSDWQAGKKHLGAYRVGMPEQRRIFHKLYKTIAESGKWQSAESLLAVLPLPGNSLKAYCWLFAALGLLEITWTDETTAGESPYSRLNALRITDLGRWCLGLGEKPESARTGSVNAIADRELFLVTVRGAPLETTLYLDKIGSKIGKKEEKSGEAAQKNTVQRWKISHESFIQGARGTADIEERIENFRRLISAENAPHWEALFARALEGAGFLERKRLPATVYDFSDSKDYLNEIQADPDFQDCAEVTRNGLLVVPAKKAQKFAKLLERHGIT